ncbi:MAG: ATP-binding protein [Pseudomonadota bacterium]
MKNKIQNNTKKFIFNILAFILIWSISVVLSLVWNIHKTNGQALKSAELSAKNSFNRDQAMRFWFAKNGGVYLKVSENINPIQSIKHYPKRDITDMDNGAFYTLYDPSTILKKMMEDFPDFFTTKVRLVSDYPLNKMNIPDQHEQKVLMEMKQGLKFSTEIKQFNGKQFLQVMYPLWANRGCLSCHNKKINIGDLIGAAGVQIDMTPFLVSANLTIRNLVMSHSLIWVLGFIGIMLFYRQVKFWINSHLELQNQLLESQSNLELRVKQRTKDLNKLSVAVEGSPAIIMITDVNNKIEYVNPVFTKVTGFTKEEIIGQTPAKFKSDLNDSHMYQQMWDALKSRGVWHGEFCNRRKDGSLYWVSSAISPILSDTGEIQNFIAIQEDITEKKWFELELIKAKENAESSSRAKSEFLSNMSHELRTPLNAILGFAELFEYDKSLDIQHKNNAKKIHSAGDHLLKLINDVLDLSKIDSGQISIQNEVISSKKLISECVFLVKSIAKEKNISVNFTQPLCDCTLYADYTRTKQIVLNLLSNAIKYNKKNGTVDINCNNCENGNLRIAIIDNGIGINTEKQKQLFEPFNRLGAEQSNIEGTGVGLYISKQLIDMMKGKIGLETNQKSGTTFWIELPIQKINNISSKEDATSLIGIEKLNNKNSHYSGTIKRFILYLDNHCSSIQLMKQIIEKENNINLLEAKTLQQGIDVLSNQKLVNRKHLLLIILDTDNLGETCIPRLIQLQKQNSLVEFPIIAIGTHGNTNEQYDKTEYISKPVNVHLFVSRITDIFDKL